MTSFLSRSNISIEPSVRSIFITLPLTYFVVLVGFNDCEACLLKTLANFTMLFSEPPVILDVSVYLKSARAGTQPESNSRQSRAEQGFFTRPPGAMLGFNWPKA